MRKLLTLISSVFFIFLVHMGQAQITYYNTFQSGINDTYASNMFVSIFNAYPGSGSVGNYIAIYESMSPGNSNFPFLAMELEGGAPWSGAIYNYTYGSYWSFYSSGYGHNDPMPQTFTNRFYMTAPGWIRVSTQKQDIWGTITVDGTAYNFTAPWISSTDVVYLAAGFHVVSGSYYYNSQSGLSAYAIFITGQGAGTITPMASAPSPAGNLSISGSGYPSNVVNWTVN